MEDVKEEMAKIRAKKSPAAFELQKYVRYLMNVLKYDSEAVFEDVPHWDKKAVENAVREVERENLKPTPKRYYVSLKEPLEDEGMR